jgi:hypothetical protein
MLSKNLALASSNYLRLKGQLAHSHNQDRRPSFDARLGHSQNQDRRPSFDARLGHSQNQDRRLSVDSHYRERHQAMIELQEHLGKGGTTTDEIEYLMGSPTRILDEPDEALLREFKRNNENYEYPQDAKIWIYEWRSNHDYVYFLISKDKKVIQSSWCYGFK